MELGGEGAAGRLPAPDALMGQLAGAHGCSAVSTPGPQHMRDEPSPREAVWPVVEL